MSDVQSLNKLPQEALDECAREPIHIPGGIQPFGALLALDDGLHVRQCSANVTDYLQRPLEEVLNRPLVELVGQQAEGRIRGALAELASGVVEDLGLLYGQDGPAFGLRHLRHLVHHHDGVSIVELIPEAPVTDRQGVGQKRTLDPVLLGESLHWGASQVMADLPIETFSGKMVQQIRQLTGFDRVMTFRFGPEWHGEVISESKRDDLDPYLGLRYPSSDIPPQARALYVLSKIRVLADARQDAVPIVPRLNPITGRNLDLTYARLRAISPIHREYSVNMGLLASLVASIVVEGKLWGLIICHHAQPLLASNATIGFLQGVAELIAANITISESRDRTRGILCSQELLQRLPNVLNQHTSWATGLVAAEAGVQEAFKADGLAVLDEGAVYAKGQAPTADDVRRLGSWLDQQGEQLLITSQLGIDNPEFAGIAAVASGLVAMQVPHSKGSWVMWFRPEEAETVRWAGDPRKGLTDRNGAQRLGPRKSFEQWLDMVRGKSRPWAPLELAIAGDAVRTNLLDVLVSWQKLKIADLGTYHGILFRQVNDAVIVTDVSYRVKFWNEAATQIFGFSSAEMLGRNLLDRYPAGRREEITRRFQSVLDGKEFVGDWLDIRKNGEPVWVHVRTQKVLGDHQEVLGLMNISRDITGLKKAEEHALRLNAELERRVEERTAELAMANAELGKASRLKDEFLASMSHELRTPLNGVLALSESLQEQVYGPVSPEQASALRDIEQSGRHLLTLINDILDLSKIEAGHVVLEFDRTAVEGVCQAALRLVKEMAHKKRQRVTLSVDGPVSVILADERRLKQILVNLLSNAVKFTPDGGQVGLEVTGHADRELVTFCVWDTGIGIRADQMGLLFKPFQQIDSRLAREYSGTGLGLALVSRMVDLHGGSVAVESEPGKGSRFTVSLPWKSVDLVADSQHHDESTAPTQTLLLIHDSRADMSQLLRYLEQTRVRTIVHPGADGAIDRIRDERPDVILIDLLPQEGCGRQVLTALKTDPELHAIPVIGLSVVDDSVRVLELGAADHLVKPIAGETLRGSLARMRALTDAAGPVVSPAVEPTGQLLLLAEDNQVNARTLSDFLRAAGYRVVLALDGHQAVEKARHLLPGLILMDIQMPHMDGLEATRQLRADPSTRDIPIVAITALAMPGDRDLCLEAGANEYVAKPLSLKQLLAVVSRLIGGSSSNQRSG